MSPISTFQERANRLAEHLTFKSVAESCETETYHLRGDDGGMGFTRIEMTHAVSQTTVTMTGKRTGRKLQYIGVSKADTFNDVIKRLNEALADDLPDDENGLFDVLADYFDEIEDPETDRVSAPNDLIVITNEVGDVVDVVGTGSEMDRRYIHVKTIGDGSTLGTIPHRFEMNQNIDSRSQIVAFFDEAVADYEKKMAKDAEKTSAPETND